MNKTIDDYRKIEAVYAAKIQERAERMIETSIGMTVDELTEDLPEQIDERVFEWMASKWDILPLNFAVSAINALFEEVQQLRQENGTLSALLSEARQEANDAECRLRELMEAQNG